jgi:hypothetical protein
MDASYNRLKLKLDMVYRDLPAEEAQKQFAELSEAPEDAALGRVGVKVLGDIKKRANKKLVKELVPKKRGRKVVKALVPENK